MTKIQRIIFILLLSLATFIMSLTLTGLSPLTTRLMQEWGESSANIQWLTTIFMLTMALVMPLSPWLFNNLLFKKLFSLLLFLFIIGTGLMITVDNFFLALIGRVLEACALGILFPIFQTALMLITPPDRRGVIMGVAGLIMSFSIAAGSVLTSLVMAVITWQELFLLYLLICLACLILTFFFAPNLVKPCGEKLDYWSLLLSLGFALLLYVINSLSQGQIKTIQILLFLVSLVLIWTFCHRQLHLKKPLLQIKILKYGSFDICLLLSGIAYSSLIMITSVFPLYYQKALQTSPLLSGLSLLGPAVLLALTNLLGGRLADNFGFKKIMVSGMLLTTFSYLLLCLIQERLHLPALIILTSLIEIGTGFVMMPATTYGIDLLPIKMMAHGTAIITTVRQLMGSLASALTAILLNQLALRSSYEPILICFALFNLFVLILTHFLKKEDSQ